MERADGIDLTTGDDMRPDARSARSRRASPSAAQLAAKA
jgi:hypothetical protein